MSNLYSSEVCMDRIMVLMHHDSVHVLNYRMISKMLEWKHLQLNKISA